MKNVEYIVQCKKKIFKNNFFGRGQFNVGQYDILIMALIHVLQVSMYSLLKTLVNISFDYFYASFLSDPPLRC